MQKKLKFDLTKKKFSWAYVLLKQIHSRSCLMEYKKYKMMEEESKKEERKKEERERERKRIKNFALHFTMSFS